jgi:hypothetical protein
MHDAEAVQVLYSKPDLVTKLLHSGLTEVKLAALGVIERVFARHVLQHDEVVLDVLEDVDKLDDVGVLAHLQNLYFLPLLDDFDRLHVGFQHSLDCHLFVGFLVLGKLNESELTLAERLRELIKVHD